MPFSVCHYHVIWATKNRALWLTPEIEKVVFETIRRKSSQLNSPVTAVNGIHDHVHVVVSIAVTVSVAEWVKGVKGVSAYEVNNVYSALAEKFQWQGGYGVLTCGAKNLPFVVSYVEHQKEHHANARLEAYLERME